MCFKINYSKGVQLRASFFMAKNRLIKNENEFCVMVCSPLLSRHDSKSNAYDRL